MQFDPGMEYRPGWGDGKINCVIRSFLDWVHVILVNLKAITQLHPILFHMTFIEQNCSDVVLLEEKGLQSGQHLHSNTFSPPQKKHEGKN